MPPYVFVPLRAGNRQPAGACSRRHRLSDRGQAPALSPQLSLHGTTTADADGWRAYVRLEDPPGLSPITTVGRFDTVEAAQVATDEVWASR
jgi:hypothetical protein